jgi:hypothetical protein
MFLEVISIGAPICSTRRASCRSVVTPRTSSELWLRRTRRSSRDAGPLTHFNVFPGCVEGKGNLSDPNVENSSIRMFMSSWEPSVRVVPSPSEFSSLVKQSNRFPHTGDRCSHKERTVKRAIRDGENLSLKSTYTDSVGGSVSGSFVISNRMMVSRFWFRCSGIQAGFVGSTVVSSRKGGGIYAVYSSL